MMHATSRQTIDDTATAQPNTRWKAISVGIAVVLAALLLAYSLSGVDWREVGRILRGANPRRLALAMMMLSGALFVRALRWRVLLNARGSVSVRTAFWATAVAYLGNTCLPARAGEVLRTLIVHGRSTLEVPYILVTALSERVVDAIVLVLISAAVLLALPAQTDWLASATRSFATLGLLGALAIALLPLLESHFQRALAHTPLPASVRRPLLSALEHGVNGIRPFHEVHRLAGFVGLTAVIWTMDALGTVIGASALGLSIPISVAFLLIAALGLGSALPSTPGYVGIYQFVAVSVLVPFGFSRTDAIAYILFAQALMFLVCGVWGSMGLLYYRRTPWFPAKTQASMRLWHPGPKLHQPDAAAETSNRDRNIGLSSD